MHDVSSPQTAKRLRAFVWLAVGVLATIAACVGGPTADESLSVLKSTGTERALRRAYDGAPPTIPHEELGTDCTSCHGERGVGIAGLGFSPPSPHGDTPGMGAARCRQCHVPMTTDGVLVKSTFVGLASNLGARREPAPRQHELAPPVIPHRLFLRESCLACHGGPAAREEIRTSHPERVRCLQCHAEVSAAVDETFPPAS